MGIFDKLFKGSNSNKGSQNIGRHGRNQFSLNMEKDFNRYGIINEVQGKMTRPQYDEKTSLRVLLSGVGISQTKISQIIDKQSNAEEMYNAALMECDKYELNRYAPERACLSETYRIKDRILIKFIADKLSLTECIEYSFLYLLNEVGVILFWSPNKTSIDTFYWNTLNNILSQDNYSSILKFFDQRMIACFDYFLCNKGNMTIDEVMSWGYNFLKMNSQSGVTIHGSLYKCLGENTVIEILNRIIQVIINSKSPSLKKILIKEKAEEKDISVQRYNLGKMKKHKSFRNAYLIGQNEIGYLNDDFLEISSCINSNSEITKMIGNVEISVDNIDFSDESTRLDYTEFTPTGKTPKYPYRICAFANRIETRTSSNPGYSVVVEYDVKQEVGKFKFTNFVKNKVIEVQGKNTKDGLVVSSLSIDGKKVV